MLYLYRMKKAIIYCISSPLSSKCYIGATSENIKKRISHHKSNAKRNGFCKSKEIIKLHKWDYHILEEFEYNPKNKYNMKKQLEYYYLNGGLEVVNKNIPIIIPMKRYKRNYYNYYYNSN
jgi:hypothetical protein